jgi:hypothetical protein
VCMCLYVLVLCMHVHVDICVYILLYLRERECDQVTLYDIDLCCLMFADDLVLVSRTRAGLQSNSTHIVPNRDLL